MDQIAAGKMPPGMRPAIGIIGDARGLVEDMVNPFEADWMRIVHPAPRWGQMVFGIVGVLNGAASRRGQWDERHTKRNKPLMREPQVLHFVTPVCSHEAFASARNESVFEPIGQFKSNWAGAAGRDGLQLFSGLIPRSCLAPTGPARNLPPSQCNMTEPTIHDLSVLLRTPEPPGLGPGPRPHVESIHALRDRLDDLKRSHGFSAPQVVLLQALVLLWHDHLHAAHALVQDMPDADAGLIHAILHRRESDYSNAKYWFRSVGPHPIDQPLGAIASELARTAGFEELNQRLVPSGAWAPLAFVDHCQECVELPAADTRRILAVQIQREESWLLLEHLSRSP
jgi:hypothetical protein